MTFISAALAKESSLIANVGYSPAARVLAVTFISGRVYHYRDVEEDVYDAFVNAESPGQFFNRQIKGKYESQLQEHPTNGHETA